MKIIKTIFDLRPYIKQWKQQEKTIAFVPTMGNLHDGHIKLVSTALQQAEKTVVSIFVNPTQFGIGEDYATYPRTQQQDMERLQHNQVDLLFMPTVEEIYPQPGLINISITGLADIYCGQSRPGHFNGVATVVCKLFNIVQPDLAFFGEKDFQQLIVLRRMVADLNFPIQIQGVPVVREKDGLAMSSRNAYLASNQRKVAVKLYQALCQARDAVLSGQQEFQSIIDGQLKMLRNAGFKPDYLAICNAHDLTQATKNDRDLVILAAAWLGRTRLIDNIRISR